MSDEFTKAAEYVRTMPPVVKATNEQKLNFYGLYKQATVGDNTTPKPGMLQIEAGKKWSAWTEKKGSDKDAAMKQYVAELDMLAPNWR